MLQKKGRNERHYFQTLTSFEKEEWGIFFFFFFFKLGKTTIVLSLFNILSMIAAFADLRHRQGMFKKYVFKNKRRAQ